MRNWENPLALALALALIVPITEVSTTINIGR